MGHLRHFPGIPGEFPVRGLFSVLLEWFNQLDQSFLSVYREEIRYHGLQPNIAIRIDAGPITVPACISSGRGIELYESFLQYLWCIGYSAHVFFREGFMNPKLEGRFRGVLDVENQFMQKAERVFQMALEMRNSFSPLEFDQLPNPIEHDPIDKEYVEKANAIYAAAGSFIILHEFAHHYLGHLQVEANNEQSKLDELAADNYALDVIKQSMGTDQRRDVTHVLGVSTALIAVMILDSELDGGSRHPRPDVRLANAVEALGIDDDSQWAALCMGLYLWAKTHPHEIMVPRTIESFKDMFYIILRQMQTHRVDP
ncbi:MAG: phage exclusion protein Lit family protein [Flavobacteriales bacterium]